MSSTSGTLGRGGMKTKLEAAKMALNSGAETWVASGLDDDTLLRIYRGEKVGTKISSKNPLFNQENFGLPLLVLSQEPLL